MKLHSGDLYWNKTMDANSKFDKITKSFHTEILIVGGGMSAALTAHVLAANGMEVTVVERHRIGEGSSAANTGLLQYTSDKMLSDFVDDIGEEQAVLFYKMCLNAMKHLDSINAQLSDDTEYINKDSIYYASSDEDVQKLKVEFEYLKKYQFPVEFLTNEELIKRYSIDKPCAIKTCGDAEVNPFKFIQALTQMNDELGVRYYEHTEIDLDNLIENKVFTIDGHSITCEHLILTTGYVKQYPAIHNKSKINRTYAFCSKPLSSSPWKDEVMIWETKNPYLYFRTTKDHRIIAGGLDEEIDYVEENQNFILAKANDIKNQIQSIFPEIDIEISYAWNALFGSSVDGLPFIGRDPQMKSVYYLLGYEGNGTCYSMAGALILNDLINNKKNPYEDIVKVNRKKGVQN
ncbi:NAD(P)/FAD-dependent oxidoreductase [Sporosarcina siberiensis]|uniref:NAD(P)/FAD-dependent oxidoreductase n=1 Tax=Sporosarcina siberiensis TaxID=1365606 RepID=A0ABW4SEU5_9BACL